MKRHFAFDIIFLAFAAFVFYSISFSSVKITEKTPANQRDQSFIFPLNFTKMQAPLYSRLIFVIVDGITYDFVDNRIKDIPYLRGQECETHTHKVPIFNQLLSEHPSSVIFQRLEIEPPPKTEIKISTYLRGINPAVLTLKIPEPDPYQVEIEDSVFYQIGQSKSLLNNYGYLTYYLYNYVGYHLTRNQFALDPNTESYEQLKASDDSKYEEYINIIKSQEYDTLFIYEGVFDEVGHNEGIHTTNALKAQEQTDKVIRGIVENMDDDAIMIVVSDHGKQESGSHFSCSGENEKVCNSLFFAYTKQGFIQNESFIQSIRKLEKNERIAKQAGQFSTHESMIASTLSNLLNIPIPYINAGRTAFEVYPAGKFSSRLEMLQRILQDSYTTLEQQKQFFQQIQERINYYNRNKYFTMINAIEAIENELFYETRNNLIYSESHLEAMILKIVSLQDQLQTEIYNITTCSIGLLAFAIIVGAILALKVVGEQFISMVLRKKQLKKYVFMMLTSLFSLCVLFINDISFMQCYGCIISATLIFYIGFREFRESGKLIMLLMLIALNVSMSMAEGSDSMRFISIISEMMLFGFHTMKIVNQKNISLTQKQRNMQLQISILFAAIEGVFRFEQMPYLCLGLNLVFYLFSLNLENRLNSSFFNKDLFEVDLIAINIFWKFLDLFSNNNYLEECNIFYPIILANIYLLCEVISNKKSLFSSFYLQMHLVIFAAIMFQLNNFEINYYEKDFSLVLVFLYYLPLPFIPLLFKNVGHKQLKEGVDTENQVILQNHPNQNRAKEMINGDIQQQVVEPNEKDRSEIVTKIKSGLILFSSITMLCSCIGQLLVIKNKKLFSQIDDILIFSNEYLMACVVSVLVSNVFIRG